MNKLRSGKYKTNPDAGSGSIFTKITKRYSTLSNKIIKRQSPGRSGVSPTKVISGSYNMTGSNSEDHRLEIGEPILISTTTLSPDHMESMAGRYRTLPIADPRAGSSSSENEVFVDAVDSLSAVPDIKFEFEPRSPITTGKESSPEINDTSAAEVEEVKDVMDNYYETPKSRKVLRKTHSKSAQSLHRSELKVFLQKAPSLELNNKVTIGDLGVSLSQADEENKENAIPVQSKSEPNTPLCPDKALLPQQQQQQHYQSVDSINVEVRKNRRNSNFASNGTLNHGSKDSVVCDGSIENFDMKSVSCQSLTAQNLFLSIDELNEITRQINESEDFTKDIDLEYCTHRDNLKPSERRITLLKNKNSRLMNFSQNKEKINNAWSGLKNWIGEESVRFKEVVQKQAAMQRVGHNFSPEAKVSPVRSARGDSVERTQDSESVMASSLYLPQLSALNTSTVVGADDEDLESSVTTLQHGEVLPFSKKPRLKEKWEGQNGFEELRRYIKQGGDFGKELILILQERVESEQLYSKSLSKMATKLNKACRELPGSIADAWRGVATEMESRSEIHRQLSSSLVDELVKPLKTLVENHHKTRKSVENNVDKSSRVLAEWRISEAKGKKASHTAARENEKLQDGMLDVRIQKSPSIALLHQGSNKVAAEKEMKSAEKDCAKLDNKRRKAEEAVKRADVEYYTLCVRAERARVDWEMSVLRGSSLLQNVETQRLASMKMFVTNYLRLTANMNPILDGLVQRLTPTVEACNVQKDLSVIKNIRRIAEGPSEQLLPDFYCEHTTLAMNRERRKHALIKLLQLVKTDLERERRSRNGLKGLSDSLNNQENQNITDKLYHIRSMLTYLEGARFKLHSALLELDHKPRSQHPLAQHIQITRDRTGLQQSILKVPLWLKNNDKMSSPESHDNEYDVVHEENGSCSDVKNDILVRHFKRSQSNLETMSNGGSTQICVGDKANTIPSTVLDSPYFDRGIADGGSNQPDSDFDEFSSQDGEDSEEVIKPQQNGGVPLTNGQAPVEDSSATDDANSSSAVVISRCKALYSYTPKLYDELELNPGDIIEVHVKQEDGWWLGALRNQVGIFPATYVEEFA